MKSSGVIPRLDSINDNAKLFQYYTGLKYVFTGLFRYLKPKARGMKYPNGSRTVLFDHHASRNKNRPGELRATRLEDEFLLTSVKINTHHPSEMEYAVRFGITPSNFP